jgi:hypothetical protein
MVVAFICSIAILALVMVMMCPYVMVSPIYHAGAAMWLALRPTGRGHISCAGNSTQLVGTAISFYALMVVAVVVAVVVAAVVAVTVTMTMADCPPEQHRHTS